MDHQFNGYTPYFYTQSGHQLTAMQPAPQVVPMFMPCIQKPDIVPAPKSSKSFSIEDILRRPHPRACMVDRSFLSGFSEVADTVDYRFGQGPYHWERGMWYPGLSERFIGKNCTGLVTLSSLFLFGPTLQMHFCLAHDLLRVLLQLKMPRK